MNSARTLSDFSLTRFVPVVAALCLGAVQETSRPVRADDQANPSQRGVEFFEAKIRPVLVKHCYECHADGADEIGGGLLLDTREGIRQGGDSGAAVVPKDLAQSLLLDAIEYKSFEMPPDEKLSDAVIADFRRWIQMGAADPRGGASAASQEDSWQDQPGELWSLAPVTQPERPKVRDEQWPRSGVDYFVRAAQELRGLEPVTDADPLTLLRRISIDLTGLPPSLEQISAFENDPSPAAYAQLVDQLLASPQFGERWARHWLDVVRYGESAGSSRDVLMIHAWRYRDYVIDAFNADIPFNQFVTEQIAGDLLTSETDADAKRMRVATGLLALGSKSLNGGNLQLDIIDDQIDVIGKAVLGLTVSCARCHDHKFDPIPTTDYYALAGIFQSTETYYGGSTRRPKSLDDRLKVYLPLSEQDRTQARRHSELSEQVNKLNKQRTALKKATDKLKKALPKEWEARYVALTERRTDQEATAEEDAQAQELSADDAELIADVDKFKQSEQELAEIDEQLKPLNIQLKQAPNIDYYLGVTDAKNIGDCQIRIRGDQNRKGDAVPRGFLSCVEIDQLPQVNMDESGRRELAAWLTRADHPLTARVIVNRLWQHLFGRGLVETTNNFGSSGSPPTHPELLDWLAHRFVHVHHWSMKSMIRELVLSRTYCLSSDAHEANASIDVPNEFLWRRHRRRLDAEALRDAILHASGQLDRNRPHASLVSVIGEGEVGRGINTSVLEKPFLHRSVYLPIIRGLLPEVLKVFDFPEPSNPQGVRDVTNVPTQSLYLMNSPFVIAQSEALADKLLAQRDDDAERVALAYRFTVARTASESEITRALSFVDQAETQIKAGNEKVPNARRAAWATFAQALFAGAEFRYTD